jgi:ribosomal protein S3AE
LVSSGPQVDMSRFVVSTLEQDKVRSFLKRRPSRIKAQAERKK